MPDTPSKPHESKYSPITVPERMTPQKLCDLADAIERRANEICAASRRLLETVKRCS